MEEKNISEKESLQLITEMINKAKHSIHEDGTSAILWGSVVAICGFVSFAEMYWHFTIGFNIWLLTLFAIIPQMILSVREQKQRKVRSHADEAINAIWLVYGISIFALVFYFNIVPSVTDKMLTEDGTRFFQVPTSGAAKPFHYFIASSGSLLLLLYAIPTMATGIGVKFKAMFWGAILCYIFFVISCFVSSTYDMLLNGFAGICNWLIPGFILRKKFFAQKKQMHV